MTASFISRYDRRQKLLGDLDLAHSCGIEIGALDKPLVTRADSEVSYVDHMDREALRTKYARDPNVSQRDIVAVDGVWGDRTLSDCFPGKLFDYVVASHVVEHVPNVIDWLYEVGAVLRPNGYLVLAIPDRRYSFDVLRRETDLADVVDHYLRGVRRPTPGQVFDNNANTVAFDHVAAWAPPGNNPHPSHYATRNDALAAARRSQDGMYVDGHCSVFTARSLLRLLDGLLELRLLKFRLGRFHIASVGTAEMSLILRRQPDGADAGAARTAIDRLLREDVDSEGLSLGDAVPVALPEPDTEKDRRIADLEAALSAMRNSSSWRMTAPCRTLLNGLKSTYRRRPS